MDLLSLLITHVGGSAAKFLLKNWLGGTGDVAGGLVDLAKDKIKDVAAQRKAERQFAEIGDKIAQRLLPLFERDVAAGRINAEAIIRELGLTLDGRVSAEFFLERNLDPVKLTAALRENRPLPQGMFGGAETEFYDRALDEAVRYVANIAGVLPRFQETLAAETLTRLDEIQADTRRLFLIEVKLKELANMEADLEKVLDTTERIERQVIGMASGGRQSPDAAAHAAARFEADYRHAVTQNLDYLELFGADILPESRRHSLSVAYVSLNLQRHGKKGGDMLPAAAVLNDLRPDAGRLLIRGEAGSGKSTLFRWAAIGAATCADLLSRSILVAGVTEEFEKMALNEVMVTARGGRVLSVYLPEGELTRAQFEKITWFTHLPFLIRLRHCTGGKLPSPDDFPELVAKQAGHPPQGWVRDVLKAGRGLLLLDGVDEIPGEFRDATLYGEIDAIVKAFPDNYFLVSTRPEAVPEGWLAGLGFREARINPMSHTDKGRFIDKWHEAVAERAASRDESPERVKQLADPLKAKLADAPRLSRLATNPLMCAMICALHHRLHAHAADAVEDNLPQRETALVERLCFMLLDERDRLSGLRLKGEADAFTRLDYDKKKALVTELAYHMVVNKGESVLDRDVAEGLVAKRLASMPDQRAADAPGIVQAMIERSGMLRERTPERPGEGGTPKPATIEFIHNTFKEYLAALRLVHEHDADGLLARHAMRPDWLPVVLFAAATDKPGFASGLIRKIVPEIVGADRVITRNKHGRRAKPKPVGRELRPRMLLALRCKGFALEVESELLERLQTEFRALFPPQTMADAEALAEVLGGENQELAASFLDKLDYSHELADKKVSQDDAGKCIRALRLIGTEHSQRRLHNYAQAVTDDQWPVLTELAQAMNPLEIPAVQRMVQRSVESDEESDKQRSIRSQIVDLSPLAGLSGLTILNLFITQVSDLSPLARLSGLTTLYLTFTQVSDLSPLAGLSGLTTLYLGDTQVRDLSPLAGLSGLISLYLGDTQVRDLSPLAGLSGLTSLALYGTPVSDLSPLAGLRGLTTLDLRFTQVSDLSPLSRLSGLNILSLIGTPVSDLSPLAGLKKLETVYLSKGQEVRIPDSLEKVVKRY